MAGTQLPSGYGPGRRRIAPAAKLGVAVVVANLAGLIAAVYCAQQIRAVPAEQSSETILFAVYYTALCVVAVVDALWIDELVFHGAFRLQHLQGKDGARLNLKDDEAVVAASMQRSSISFPAVLILAGGLTYLLFNAVNHDFNPYYRRIGKFVSQLRGDDPADQPRRSAAIAALSIRRDPEIVPILLRQLGRGGEQGAFAAWALGRFSDIKHQRKAIVEALWAASQESDPAVTREALIALARLQHRVVAAPLQAAIRRDLDAGDLDRRLIYATGFIQTPTSLPILQEILQRGDVPSQRVAAWAIAQHRDQRDAKDVDLMLAERLPSASVLTRCALIHSLGILGNERSNLALMHAYDIATPAERSTACPSETVFLRPDGADEPADLLLPPDTMAMKIIHTMGQIRATAPEIRSVVEPWLTALVAANKEDGTLLAARAQSLLDGIRQVRDDTRGTRVDPAK
ncbi:MAG: hypothetical protein IPO88_16935 [Nannocystis sp.]|uniref:HEAT repeat domain-containing protein n=1 Tax=Nannocystis sp. TaxID=1962667 RepID=UPI0024295A16|nr:hypothetical protein [Nannocystis sp.]MBK9755151.1 hypothetical protein [Nannocystis sp.]